jgi:Fe-S-cluster containining protein
MGNDASTDLDLTLLRGFQYACRPECGLCCYAEPRIEAPEEVRLLRIAPKTDLVLHADGHFLEARPEGGACQFLNRTRCRVWEVRPSPCREFPVSVHLGERLQASLVLTCPGIDLQPLTESTAWETRAEPVGFESELSSVNSRVGRPVIRRLEEARRRRMRIVSALKHAGRWVEETDVRSALRERPPLPTPEEFPVVDLPAAEDGLERLPLFFDGRPGPVALAEGLGGWEVLELRPEGGPEPPIAVIPPPSRPPEMDAEGRRMLEGYLRYFLERDALFGTVLSGLEDEGSLSVTEAVAADLRRIGAVVLSRAELRRKLRGSGAGTLTQRDISDGIRATDQDLLDRPSWGDRL